MANTATSIRDITEKSRAHELRSSIWDGLAKRMARKALSQFTQGRLVIEDNGEVMAFGQDADSAELIANVTIHHPSAYRKMVVGGTCGAGEAYMLGSWTSPEPLDVVRFFCMNIHTMNKMDKKRPIFSKIASAIFHALNANSLGGSQRNIAAHYDLGNDFFKLFLDANMMYSAALFDAGVTDLEAAATHKLDTICKKLDLQPSDSLIEIGTGWGGMAIHAAKNYGCQVTTTTISKEQYEYAKAEIAREGLEDKITLLLQDYRDLTGQFDKLVSIEMIEAVGHQFYNEYFAKCSSLLKDDGLMVIQAITIPDQRFDSAKTAVDFIQRYIFPGGCLPSNAAIADSVRDHTDMQIVGLEDITRHYAATLHSWRDRFHANIEAVRGMGFDDVFVRMWEYYLYYCEGGFKERVISTAQIVFAKPRTVLKTPLSN